MSPQTQQMIMGLLMWVVVFGVFYFLLIRPQKKKDKELKEMRIKDQSIRLLLLDASKKKQVV